ncbi:F390 synthetase-related protein [uncultured Erythrobacter sp.]|uniref:F390 synthetase-related protein n=1 Tax=uncultured Erythrobacter sp. TaxID=263913 RepID=UPI00260CBBE5|nr:F390 synthetase-related protein [uncultured Erythrobacter sp.]
MASPNKLLYLNAVRAFALARWRAWRLRDRAAIDRHHRRQLAKLQRHALESFPYYSDCGGLRFQDWPVIDKGEMVANFADLNVAGAMAEELRDILAGGGERFRGYPIGHSTGTSGNRGYYVISDAERFQWLGTILAKTLPDALWRKHKVALALPGLSTLYRSASSGSRIELVFFDLADGVESWADELNAAAPDTIVAPPKVLRLLAERGQLPSHNIFSGAEVLDPIDRAVIEEATGRIVRQIYMATEGLFAVSCPHGALHLAEDVVHFEWEQPVPGSVLQTPIVTDFTRRSQAMIRYRMNDLVELDTSPCTCGSAFAKLRRIEGRADDIFLLETSNGEVATVTPDVVRNAIVDAHAAVRDFRARQVAPSRIELTLEAHLPPDIDEMVRAKLMERLSPFGAQPDIVIARGLDVPFDRKLRRVTREIEG